MADSAPKPPAATPAKGKTKKIDVRHDTRSNQKFTKEKLASMRPGDIAAVASQRGYDVDNATGRIGHSAFLAQQEDSEAFKDDEGYTESGEVPEDYGGVQTPNVAIGAMPSVHGGEGGLPPSELVKGKAMGEQVSEEDHTGEEKGSFTLGAIAPEPEKGTPGASGTPLINVPAEGQKA